MTKKNLIIILLLSLNLINAQVKTNSNLKNSNNNLKIWSKTFSNFSIDDFKQVEITSFKDLFTEKETITNLPVEYKTIGTYSPNKSKFVDIYSYLNLEKKGDTYIKNVEVDQNVDLYLSKTNERIRLFQSGSREGIDEVYWLSETSIVLLGVSYIEEKKPIILLVDLDTKNVIRLENQNKLCKLLTDYKSVKLKKLNIK
jgi:hypothetical protein